MTFWPAADVAEAAGEEVAAVECAVVAAEFLALAAEVVAIVEDTVAAIAEALQTAHLRCRDRPLDHHR